MTWILVSLFGRSWGDEWTGSRQRPAGIDPLSADPIRFDHVAASQGCRSSRRRWARTSLPLGTKPLARKVDEAPTISRDSPSNLPVLHGYTETHHQAKSWDRERRTVARI